MENHHTERLNPQGKFCVISALDNFTEPKTAIGRDHQKSVKFCSMSANLICRMTPSGIPALGLLSSISDYLVIAMYFITGKHEFVTDKFHTSNIC